MIVATLDGNQQQQTWQNIARAAATAAQLAEQGGTIVLWSNIAEAPTNSLLSIMSEDDLSTDSESLGEDEFPEWDPLLEPAKTLRSLVHEYRILLRSQLSPEDTESLGMGVIGSADELSHLTRSFSACRVLRAASFCCSSTTSQRSQSRESVRINAEWGWFCASSLVRYSLANANRVISSACTF